MFDCCLELKKDTGGRISELFICYGEVKVLKSR